VASNAGEQRGQGLELELEWALGSGWKLESYLALVDVELEVGGLKGEVPDVPSRLGYIGLSGTVLNDWETMLKINYVGGRERAAGDTRDELDDFTDVDLVVRRTFFGTDVSLVINNLFDEEQFEGGPAATRVDSQQAGRSGYIEISRRF